MKYLFIGGPADGRRYEVADGQFSVVIPAFNEAPFSRVDGPDGNYDTRDYLYYRRRLGFHEVYVYHGLSTSEAVEILIRRYPQPL